MPRFVVDPYSLGLAPGKGDHGCSLPTSPQAPPLLNSSVPGCPEPVTPINRGCIHQEGAWAASALKPGKTSGSCQLEVGEVGHFLLGSQRAGLGQPRGSPDTVCTGLMPQETRQSVEPQSSLLYNGNNPVR